MLVRNQRPWHDVAVMRNICQYGILFVLLSVSNILHAENDNPWDKSRSPELGQLLRELNQQYGPDTVSLMSWLNDASIHSGSVLTSSIRVNGKETRENTTFLVFQVETGIIFNTQTINQAGRLVALWEKILAKAFSHFDTLRVPADGVTVVLLSHCLSFPETDDLSEHVDEPGPLEEVKFYFPGEPLRAYLGKQLSAQGLLARIQVLIDGAPVNYPLPGGVTTTDASIIFRETSHLRKPLASFRIHQ
jgi:hypothetical protein